MIILQRAVDYKNPTVDYVGELDLIWLNGWYNRVYVAPSIASEDNYHIRPIRATDFIVSVWHYKVVVKITGKYSKVLPRL